MKKRSTLNVMSRLILLVKPLTPFMCIAILLGVLGFLAAIFITIFGGYALLNVLGYTTPFTLKITFVFIAIFGITRGFLRYGEQACNHFIAFKLLALIRDRVFHSFRKLAPAKLESKDKGNLIAILTSDIELLEVFYAHTISPIIIAFIISIIMVIFISSYHPFLGIIALAGYVSVGIIIPFISSRYSKKNGEIYRELFGDLNTFFLDSLRGIKESIQYNCGDKRRAKIRQRSEEMSKLEKEMKGNASIILAITNTIIFLFTFFMLFGAATMYYYGIIEFDGILIPTIAILSSFGPVIAVANLGNGLSQTIASGNRVLDILDETPLVQDVIDKNDIIFNGAQFQDVNFSYNHEKIIKNLTFEIPQNKIIGITGKSGSGKSTLLKLLMRFWDCQSGNITLSNININDINTQSLRDHESYVTQETHLFHDSIKNNLLIAKLDATQEEIVMACKKASVHDFIISLPKGYDTEIGELGNTLSGGEKQRIGLARAFLHNAPLILLDEPTSNLDSLNEAIILKALKEDENRTTILVSHRKSTMKIADIVYSIENGRLS